jgi:hypothetical protein
MKTGIVCLEVEYEEDLDDTVFFLDCCGSWQFDSSGNCIVCSVIGM